MPNKDKNNYTLSIQNILRVTPSSIYWKDLDGKYLGCNETMLKMVGMRSEKEVIGKTDYDLPWKDSADTLRKHDRKAIESGQLQCFEETGQLSDGTMLTVITQKMPIIDEGGKVVGVVGSSIDITQLKETQKELEKSKLDAEAGSAAKSKFIANMSHDLRTPMTGVLTMLEGVTFTIEDIEKLFQHEINILPPKYQTIFNNLLAQEKEYITAAKTSSNQLINLFNEILEAVRLESGQIKPKLITFSIKNLIQKNIDLLQAVASDKKLKLSYKINDGVPTYFKGFQLCIDRCLTNLISNALKFTETGAITIRVSTIDAKKSYTIGNDVTLSIAVEDTGIGIPEDKFEEIFQPFSRLTSSYHGIYEGIGLGLSAVKQYLKILGGDIQLKSQIGKGSCFTFIIPLEVIAESEMKMISSDDETTVTFAKTDILPIKKNSSVISKKEISSEKNKTKVLLVEDHPIAAMGASCLLERLGCAVDVAKTGQEAVDKVMQNNYDLIFMDVGLPDFEGTEATKRIRALPNLVKSQVPILALTGHAGDAEKQQECFDAGMQGVLSKPPEISSLEQALKQWARNATSKKKIKPDCLLHV